MTAYNSANYTKQIAVPKQMIDKGDLTGNLHVIHDTFAVTGAIADNSTIDSVFLPEGAKIVDAWAYCTTLGATGIFTLGNKACVDSSGNAIAASKISVVGNVDVGGQTAFTQMAAAQFAEGLIGTKIGVGGCQLQIDFNEEAAGTAGVIKICVVYSI